MKYIRKQGAPQSYRDWRNLVRGTNDEDYRELRNPEKADLLVTLLREQGWLCAYTMRRIDSDSAHIEHIKPETLCRAQQTGSDLDYGNLVACFPRDGMKKAYRYGAQKKGELWKDEGAKFVSPLHPVCEQRFHYDLRGEIAAVGNHAAAVATIKVLALCHRSITDDRKRVIEEFIYGANGHDPFSPAKATRAKATVCHLNLDGRFYEFCIAIRDALDEYLTALQKEARRRKFARRRN